MYLSHLLCLGPNGTIFHNKSEISPIMDGERSLKTAAVEVVVLEEREKLTHDNGT